MKQNWERGITRKNKRLYKIWSGMKARCYCKTSTSYKWYGAKGIIICDEWLNYNNFYNWAISSGYLDNLTIERSNTNDNYEPSKCKWITMLEQVKTKKNIHLINYGEDKKTVREMMGILNISEHAVKVRFGIFQKYPSTIKNKKIATR